MTRTETYQKIGLIILFLKLKITVLHLHKFRTMACQAEFLHNSLLSAAYFCLGGLFFINPYTCYFLRFLPKLIKVLSLILCNSGWTLTLTYRFTLAPPPRPTQSIRNKLVSIRWKVGLIVIWIKAISCSGSINSNYHFRHVIIPGLKQSCYKQWHPVAS